MARLYENNFSTTLDGAITNVATSMTLTSVTGFPAVGGGDTAQITLSDGTNVEVVTATAIAGSVVTITRAQEGTSGFGFADLDTVELRETALSFTDVLAGDTSPTLIGPLDMADAAAYASFGGSSTTTAYNLIGSGGVPRLTGAANYWYSFTSSSLYMQAGTTWNNITFKNDSTRLTITTNNFERMQVDDSGVNISNGDLAINTGDLSMATSTGVKDTNGNYIAQWQVLSASAVNNIEIANNSAGNAPRITAIGSDTNVDLELRGKGSGSILSINEHHVGNTGGTQTIRIDGTATTPSIGTSTNHDMLIKHNDLEVAKVLDTGLELSGTYLDFGDTYGIRDTNGNEQILFSSTASAVNYVNITNAATGNGVDVASAGGDANIDLLLTPKGSGNVGIGTSTPDQKLHVQGGGISVNRPNDDSVMSFQNSTSGATWAIGRDYSASESLVFAYNPTAYASLTGSPIMLLTTGGNLGIGTTSPGAKLDVNGAIHADSISFDSGTNVLDEYEEGTFTPTLDFATTGDLSNAYTTQLGRYTRIGDFVIIRFQLDLVPTFTTASGELRLSSLPFTSSSSDNLTGQINEHNSNLTYPAGRTYLAPNPVGTYANIKAFGTGVNSSKIQASNVTSGVQLKLSMNAYYYIA